MPPISQMVRAAVMVSDLARSRDFYENVLGLTEVFFEAERASGGNSHLLLGMPSTLTSRVCILKAPGKPAYGMVGLFELNNPKPPALTRDGMGANIGEAILVFYCEDLDEVTLKAKERGLSIIGGPMPYRVGGRVKQREMILCGPDGEKINLIEWNVAKADAGERPEKWTGVTE
jgi:catechol 2,3-dioxygenase-like lactoylglutathione lyase family enzyme